jgi:hypothetical protein
MNRTEDTMNLTPEPQFYEVEEWLGDHSLTASQFKDLVRAAIEIQVAWPDLDDREERDAALVSVYESMIDSPC